MTRPKHERSASVPKMIFLILSAALIGCAGLPKFPVKQVRMLDVQNQACGLYDMTPTSGKPKYTWVRDLSLRECDGSVCSSPVDYKKAEAWAINANQDYSCKLKE